MPEYCYKCPECDRKDSMVRSITATTPILICLDCQDIYRIRTFMVRDYVTEGVNIGIKEYAKPLVSESLGMHPEQIPEHKKRFPKIEVTPQGQPVFHNTNEHSKYLKDIGWDKNIQKKRSKGKKLELIK